VTEDFDVETKIFSKYVAMRRKIFGVFCGWVTMVRGAKPLVIYAYTNLAYYSTFVIYLLDN